MRFAKYQGIGNDFVMLSDPRDEIVLAPGLVRHLCDRRFGIGADGVIRAAPGRNGAALFMDYVNSDGSIGEMCGNGIRCLALFARAEGLVDAAELEIETRAGTKVVTVLKGSQVAVDVGPPGFSPSDIPVHWDGADALHTKLELPGGVIEAACLSMGNPHAVLFVDDPTVAPVTTLGPAIERHDAFPKGANVEFVRVVSPDRLEMRVWERGSGETLACGTGACAAAVAARVVHGADEDVVVGLPGGDLEIAWSGSLDRIAPVRLTGPATESFRGEIDLGKLP
jgi:diaminopimelate epimerase